MRSDQKKSKAKKSSFFIYFSLFFWAFSCIAPNKEKVKELNNSGNVNHTATCSCSLFQPIKIRAGTRTISDTTNGFKVKGMCFTKHWIYGQTDTLIAYMARKNDSLFLIRPHDIHFKTPFVFSFLPLNSDSGNYYQYFDYNQIREDVLIIGDLIGVEILKKRIDEKDTLYLFSHTAMPFLGGTPLPKKQRYFLLSLREGIINYYQKENSYGKELDFYW